MNTSYNFTAVQRSYEKQRFSELIYSYAGRGTVNDCIDFMAMAVDWCEFVDKREATNTNIPKYYRKTPYQLEDYFKSKHKLNNIFITLNNFMKESRQFDANNTGSAVNVNETNNTVFLLYFLIYIYREYNMYIYVEFRRSFTFKYKS